MIQTRLRFAFVALTLLSAAVNADDGLVAQWKLVSDAKDSTGNHHATNHGVQFKDGSAYFDGIDAWLEVPAGSIEFGTSDFSIAAWIHTEQELDDVLGDVASCYDPKTRKGFNLSLMNYAGVTSAQSNWRNVLFGIDDAQVDSKWTDCGRPGTNQQVKSLVVFDGGLYAAVWEPDEGKAGHVYRYAGGTSWKQLGPVPDTTQVYSTAVYEGRIHAGTWPTGSVFRYEGPQEWINTGRLGEEKEVMGMAVYNGKLYAGTLPLADVYRYDGQDKWVSIGQLDTTPNVRYRRAWVTAVYDGKLFCGVLPSGHVLSLEAGKCVTYDRAFPAGWHHLAAVKSGDQLKLYIDGKHAAASTEFDSTKFDLNSGNPLKIGFGQHDYFNGKMKDMRIYSRALSSREVAAHAQQ